MTRMTPTRRADEPWATAWLKVRAGSADNSIRMLAAIFYTLGCFVLASALTFIWALTRPIKARDEMRSWRVLLGLFAICFGGPYLYNEVLTRLFGPELATAVESGYSRVPIDGPLQYFKVTSYSGDSAKVLVVAKEQQEWGGTDRPMIWLTLVREKDDWKCDSYRIANSAKFDRESYIFPVYW